MIKISVVLATCNGVRFIDEQILSLLRQDRLPDEIIISDDASDDGTSDRIIHYSRLVGPMIKIISNRSRLGYVRNFIAASQLVTGNIIFFCDQDDIWHPEKIATVIEFMQSTGCMLVTHDLQTITSSPKASITKSYFEDLRGSALPPDFNVKGCCLAYKRDLIDRIGWPREGSLWTHDTWLSHITSTFSYRCFLQDVLIDYRIHDKNVSGWMFTDRSSFKRYLRRIRLPIFGRRNYFDDLIGSCIDGDLLNDYVYDVARLQRLAPERAQQALDAAARKLKVVELQRSAQYRHILPRTVWATALLFGGYYRSAGDLSGYLSDLFAKRRLLAKPRRS